MKRTMKWSAGLRSGANLLRRHHAGRRPSPRLASQREASDLCRPEDNYEQFNPEPAACPEWLELLLKQISTLRFGTVQLTVQDSKVVQIETTEKLRLDKPPAQPAR